MNVMLTHKLEFSAKAEPTIQELQNMLELALKDGFPPDTPVHIRAGEDAREHDYFFYATFGRPKKEM